MNTDSSFRRWAITGCVFCIAATPATAQTTLPGFEKGEAFDEQVKTYNFDPDVLVHLNAPAPDQFHPDKPTRLIVFALPNGNTIEMTEGRKLTDGLDWHFDIQHIGAQIRRLREILPEQNWVVAYLEAGGLSWPRWRQTHDDAGSHLLRLLDDLRSQFGDRQIDVELTSHSGGGSLIFGVINHLDAIPDWINRIVFLDSNYGYSDQQPHAEKLLDWLQRDASNRLCVTAYDDRNIELDGKRIIGPTGGTYRRTLEMVERFSRDLELNEFNVDDYRRWRGLDNRLEFIVLNNAENIILHTVMVERNGLIHALTFGTNNEGRAGVFWGPRSYEKWIHGQQQDADYGIWSLLPPILAIVLAIATRQVFLSLFAGIWVGHLVMAGGHPIKSLIAALEACVNVFKDAGNTKVVLFCAMVGALIALVQRSGGVDGFVNLLHDTGVVRGRRSAGILASVCGMLVFVESSISCLVTGAVARPIFDRLRMSRERLAYVCDTSSAPTCILIPINGWGAFVLVQLTALGAASPVVLMTGAIAFNFYAILSLIILFITSATDRDIGPMKRAQRRAQIEGKLHADGAQPLVADDVIAMAPRTDVATRARNMILPVLVMVVMVFVGLLYTGLTNLPEVHEGDIWAVLESSSGTTAVFWAVLAAVAFAGLLYRLQGIMKLPEFIEVSFKGAGSLVPLAVLMTLAFAIGALCKDDLHTGQYVASLVPENLPAYWAAPLIFLVACFIAFSTGTSWGTFAIMLPIAWAIALKLDLRPELAVAAVLGGGVFGDHCSPISDTTIVSSMASASDHIDHVRTQMPYAVTAAAGTVVLYAIVGAIL